jgi:hypothetical protein
MFEWRMETDSHHDGFEGRGLRCVRMGYIDDATDLAHARFYAYEGTNCGFAAASLINVKTGHFHFAKNRTFLLWVDNGNASC